MDNKTYTAEIKRSASAPKRRKRKGLKSFPVIFAGVFFAVLICAAVAVIVGRESEAEEPIAVRAADIEINGTSEAEGAKTVSAHPAEDAAKLHTVTLSFYGKDDIVCLTGDITVGALLDAAGVTLGENNILKNEMDQMITDSTVIEVDEIKSDSVEVWSEIPYETQYVYVETIPKGESRLIQAGYAGSRLQTFDCEIVNGEEVSRKLTSETVAKYPQNAIYYVGSGGTFTGKDGVTYSFSYYIDVTATYYTRESSPSDTTYSGMKVSDSVMAVDPRVIPLLTKVYVSNEVRDYGVRIAADIGGGIIGNKIDLFLENPDEYISWYGVIPCRVYILE